MEELGGLDMQLQELKELDAANALGNDDGLIFSSAHNGLAEDLGLLSPPGLNQPTGSTVAPGSVPMLGPSQGPTSGTLDATAAGLQGASTMAPPQQQQQQRLLNSHAGSSEGEASGVAAQQETEPADSAQAGSKRSRREQEQEAGRLRQSSR